MLQNFKLINKKNLTYNVYELTFEWEKKLEIKPWQFITFLLEKIWGRAYSILKIEWNNLVLIIKKRELEEWWRWWSKFICELNIWESLKWVWPAWHFILKENTKNKLFLWTGTWFVPLYNQIIWWLEAKLNCNFKLIFWARTLNDLFYIDELNELKNKNSNFDFEVFLSREDKHNYKNWYITDFINNDTKNIFEEVYICGTPNMIDSSIEILQKAWFEKENIFTEKY